MQLNRTALIVPLLAAGSLTLVACGGESNSDDSATSPTPAPTEDPETTEAEPAPTEDPEATRAPVGANNIVDVAVGAGDFTSLVLAIQSADLGYTLMADGPFTVFAPTDAAFAALPEGLVEKLLAPENTDVLTSILTYHVVPGSLTSDMVAAGEVATVQGESISVTVDGGVQVNGANVTSVDLRASNGVIHVIDAVILPPSLDLSAL